MLSALVSAITGQSNAMDTTKTKTIESPGRKPGDSAMAALQRMRKKAATLKTNEPAQVAAVPEEVEEKEKEPSQPPEEVLRVPETQENGVEEMEDEVDEAPASQATSSQPSQQEPEEEEEEEMPDSTPAPEEKKEPETFVREDLNPVAGSKKTKDTGTKKAPEKSSSASSSSSAPSGGKGKSASGLRMLKEIEQPKTVVVTAKRHQHLRSVMSDFSLPSMRRMCLMRGLPRHSHGAKELLRAIAHGVIREMTEVSTTIADSRAAKLLTESDLTYALEQRCGLKVYYHGGGLKLSSKNKKRVSVK